MTIQYELNISGWVDHQTKSSFPAFLIAKSYCSNKPGLSGCIKITMAHKIVFKLDFGLLWWKEKIINEEMFDIVHRPLKL